MHATQKDACSTEICMQHRNMHATQKDMCSRFSNNSEAFVSEFQGNLGKVVLIYFLLQQMIMAVVKTHRSERVTYITEDVM